MSDVDGTCEQSKILVFVIVGKDDKPLLIEDLSTPGFRPDPSHLASFVAHQSLDVIDDLILTNPNLYLKQVDIFDFLAVSAYVTCGHVNFLLITRANNTNNTEFNVYGRSNSQLSPLPPSSEAIRSFFKEVHEIYCKQLMNPLYMPNQPLNSTNFKLKIHNIAKKHLI